MSLSGMQRGEKVKSHFRVKLTLIMIVFAIIISFTIATIDHLRLKEQAIINHQFQVEFIEEMVEDSLNYIEKAYRLFGEDIAQKMEASSHYLLEKYESEENSSFDAWNFEELKKTLGLDIYIINEENVITHSSFEQDIGLDFSKCCGKLVPILNERRAMGGFFDDGLDIEQQTGAIKKYSYMATHDKKYLIQLGYSLENGVIFKEYNFFKVIERLVQKYSIINEINILNLGGVSFGETVTEGKLFKERRRAFEETLQSQQIIELRHEWRGEPAIYRYVPYVSEFDQGSTKNKVLEIIYNERALQAILKKNKSTFYMQLLIVLVVTIGLALLISRWVARPMHLAFHDSLTGLKNRAAFDDIIEEALSKNKGSTALIMVDLDNFKLVNDDLGHDMGDELLKNAASSMRSVIGREDYAFRLGGDEFALILVSANKQQAETTVQLLLAAITASAAQTMPDLGPTVTVSIGVALAPEHGIHPEDLYKKADIALYASKQKGKNQYQFYAGDLSE